MSNFYSLKTITRVFSSSDNIITSVFGNLSPYYDKSVCLHLASVTVTGYDFQGKNE